MLNYASYDSNVDLKSNITNVCHPERYEWGPHYNFVHRLFLNWQKRLIYLK